MTQLEPHVPTAALPSWLQHAFAERGFTTLTPIQQAVLCADADHRDLRMASATGSGKTVAMGLALAKCVEDAVQTSDAPSDTRAASPAVLVIAPTRELAAQLETELRWLYQPVNADVALVRGGGSYPQEIRSLRNQPTVVVGTPGRLMDHLERGTLNLGRVAAAVLDEADQLLDLGFRRELDTLLGSCPPERRTLLVSATFGRAVQKLADTHQKSALWVQGTPIDKPCAGIDHVAHVVPRGVHQAALINVLLNAEDGRTLVFVDRRVQAAETAEMLSSRGFDVAALSGDMAPAERVRTLERFRKGRLRVLVATDVAARGLDVDDVRTVVHAFPPRDPEALIHRSGRTGRAGQSGTSVHLVEPRDRTKLRRLFRSARIEPRWVTVPSANDVHQRLDERLSARLTERLANTSTPRAQAVAQQLLENEAPEVVVAHLVDCLLEQSTRAEEIPKELPRQREAAKSHTSGFTAFEVNWGSGEGATPQRLLAMVCRRGGIEKADVGSIRVSKRSSRVDVAAPVAARFARACARPDRRDRHVRIRATRPERRSRKKAPAGMH